MYTPFSLTIKFLFLFQNIPLSHFLVSISLPEHSSLETVVNVAKPQFQYVTITTQILLRKSIYW